MEFTDKMKTNKKEKFVEINFNNYSFKKEQIFKKWTKGVNKFQAQF